MNPIQSVSVGNASLPSVLRPMSKPQDADGFRSMLLNSIGQVNQMQVSADSAVESLFSGGDVDPAAVLTAVQKADLAFKLMMQVRNKVLQAYQEIRDIRI